MLLISYLFYTQECLRVTPNLPGHPTPPAPLGVRTFILYVCVSGSALPSPVALEHSCSHFLMNCAFSMKSLNIPPTLLIPVITDAEETVRENPFCQQVRGMLAPGASVAQPTLSCGAFPFLRARQASRPAPESTFEDLFGPEHLQGT